MRLAHNSSAKVARYNADWLTVTRDGQELGSIERQRGPFPRCAFVGWAAYRDSDNSFKEFGPLELYKAARFVEVGA